MRISLHTFILLKTTGYLYSFDICYETTEFVNSTGILTLLSAQVVTLHYSLVPFGLGYN